MITVEQIKQDHTPDLRRAASYHYGATIESPGGNEQNFPERGPGLPSSLELLFVMAASVAKKRKYIDGYINYGFTSILADGIEKPHCVLCFKVLENDSMRPMKRRINEMSDDIKEKVIQEIKLSPTGMFAIQLDESTDVSSCAQLLVFVRYVFLCDIKEEYLFCTQLETTTTAVDVMEKLSSFFTANRISRGNCCGVCTDGAPAMLGSKSGFQKRVEEVAPNAKGIHCMIHRFALASKTLPDELRKILEAVVKCTNFVKAGDLNSLFFQNLCRDMDSEYEALLFYSKVRWLSKGNVVNRVFELRGELKLFLECKGKTIY
ncbi:protein ZBED8-like [Homarus americanus]|uniref:protein ZBED8-like n=1 Tax=Homarus americanus TaxID=6706 RepID=UPI001C460CB5|nr:protein ZBED8-like [Homarus americanus]